MSFRLGLRCGPLRLTLNPVMAPIRLSGILVVGKGEGAVFTQVPWVQRTFTRILGFEPYPGTVNLRVGSDSDSKEALKDIHEARGIAIIPPEGSGFCPARCFHARLPSSLPAGLVIPEVEGYYEDILELLAPVNVRNTLGVSEGDEIEVEIELESGSNGAGLEGSEA